MKLLKRLLFELLRLGNLEIKYRNVYGGRMVLRGDIGREYFLGVGEMGTLKILEDFLKDGDFFIDIGAYVGFFSIFASKLVGEAGKVFAFEPNPLSFDVLRKNLKLNGCKNAEAFNIAIGGDDNLAILVQPKNKTPSETSFMESRGRKFRVRVRRLDDVIPKDTFKLVRMVKIDVEGWENEVLKGMRESLKMHRPIMVVENGPMFILGYEYLKSLGYTPYILEMTKRVPSKMVKVKEYEDIPLYDNVIFLP